MKVPLGGGDVVSLATSQDLPASIAVDSTSVYWTNTLGDDVVKVPLGGGPPVVLATGQTLPGGIAIYNAHLFWAVGDAVVTAPLSGVPAGGTATTIASGDGAVSSLAVDGTGVYWTTGGGASGGAVYSAPPSGVAGGGPGTIIATKQGETGAIALDTANVYWTNGQGQVMKASKTGGGATPLGPTAQVVSYDPIAVDPSTENVYWSAEGADGGAAILRMLSDGGSVVTLATGQHNPTAIAVDGTSVYWTNLGGTVMKLTPK